MAIILEYISWAGETDNYSTDTSDILFLTLFSYLILKQRLYK